MSFLPMDLIPVLSALGRLVLVASTLAALWIGARSVSPRIQRRINAVLVVFAALALFIWFNLGTFHRPLFGFVHTWDMFHYYLGSKYTPELGYFNLYGAALAADAEGSNPYFYKVNFVRDMRTYNVVRADELRQDPSFRAKFSPERWKAFREDVAHLQRRYPHHLWEKTFLDHGNNAPPSQSVVSGALANLLGRANDRSLFLLALLDPLLVAALLATVYRVYGLRTMALVAIFFGLNELSDFFHGGGSLLRMDWMVATGLGICCLRARRPFTAGCLLGAAAMLRIFPVLFGLGVVLSGGLELFRSGIWPPRHRRFALGLALGAGALVLASLGRDLDVQIWLDFVEKMQVHLADPPTNGVGLGYVFGANSYALWLARGAIALLFLFSLSRLDDAQAAILGGVLVFAFGMLARYYYSFLLIYFLWHSWERANARALVMAGLFFVSASVGVAVLRAVGASMAELAQSSSFVLLMAFAVLFAHIYVSQKPGLTLEQSKKENLHNVA